MKSTLILSGIAISAAAIFAVGCSKDDKKNGKGAGAPLVSPPVKAATPAGLQTSASLNALGTADFASRFFNSAGGPSNIFQILSNLDESIAAANSPKGDSVEKCSAQEPVAYTITVLGEEKTFYGQCAQTDTGLLFQFGKKDNVYYIFKRGVVGSTAAIIVPKVDDPTKYAVELWTSVGANNSPWDNGSHGIMHLEADSEAKTFEFVVAGSGLGYCGAQLKSDGTDLYAVGSGDMGTTCADADSLCVKAADGTTEGTCSDALKTFDLTPIGRAAASASTEMGATKYPATPNVTFTGAADDPVKFGPETATSGLGSF